jgi:phosphoglycerate dehydrogenase-like enzyme
VASTFLAGITPDARGSDGRLLFDFTPLDESSSIECRDLHVADGELAGDALAGLDALIIASSRFHVSRSTIAGADRLALIARLGAGYETIDLDACTEAAVAVTTSPEAVRRTMATAAIAFVLALTLKIPQKQSALREGRWADGASNLGLGLAGLTVGIVGLGNIGAEIARLAATFSPRILACDPNPPELDDVSPSVELVGLEDLLARSDVVVVACRLDDSTRHLLDRGRLALMKPTAFLVNIARGPIVDQDALVEMLDSGRLAGAALDVFEEEPIDPAHTLLRLPNVIATPHAIGWTDEACRIAGRAASAAVLAVAGGSFPEHVVNPEVLEHRGFLAKLAG